MVWRVVAPTGAKSVTISPPELLLLEQDRDYFRIFGCRRLPNCTESDGCTTCTEVKNMTGNVPKYSAFCDMKLNVDELRMEINLDSTANFESRYKYLCLCVCVGLSV